MNIIIFFIAILVFVWSIYGLVEFTFPYGYNCADSTKYNTKQRLFIGVICGPIALIIVILSVTMQKLGVFRFLWWIADSTAARNKRILDRLGK